jgi:hypothetical protein
VSRPGPSLGARALVAGAVTVALAAPTGPAAAHSAAVHARPRPATPELISRAVRRGEITQGQGALFLSYAFTSPRRLPAAYRSTTPWDGTLPLLELERTLDRVPATAPVTAARSDLRATSFDCDRYDSKLPRVNRTKHFYLQYGSIGGGLSANQYANTLETTWQTEISKFGWARPPKDPVSYPSNGRYPVRVQSLGSGLYGFVTSTRLAGNNPSTPWPDKDAYASCMVLNRSYAGFPSPPIDSLRSTVAHEFNHSIQFGYGALIGSPHASNVFVEGGATWMEDEVFDGSNDNYFFLWPSFTQPMGVYKASPYAYWVVFRAITEHVGPPGKPGGGEDVMQEFWETISKRDSTDLGAFARALKDAGTNLGRAYHDAAISLRFLQDCTSTAQPYCLEEGPAYAAHAGPNGNTKNLGGGITHRAIANDYALDWIGLPNDPSLDLTLDVTGGGGKLRASVGCRIGTAVTVLSPGTEVARGSTNAVFPNVDTSPCDQAVLVITNEHQTKASPSTKTFAHYDLSSP